MSSFEDLPTKTVCISHNRDADGVITAALIRHVTNCTVYLTDYDRVIQTLQKVGSATNLYICDLGTNKETEFQLVQQLQQMVKRMGICYIDHHPMSPTFMQKLVEIGVRVIHCKSDCASAITYELYKDRLPREAALLAACGAVTDAIEDGEITKKLLRRYDRDLIMLEASILSYAIAAKGEDEEFLLGLTEQMASGKLPHQIPNLCQYACEYGQRMIDLSHRIVQEGAKMKSIAHMHTVERNLGSVANFLMGEFDVPVGVAYRYKEETGKYIVSLRSANGFPPNLGELTSNTAAQVEGLGGGHSNASGAVVPKKNLAKFLELLDESIALLKH
jgi:RecJ-like exonuclease